MICLGIEGTAHTFGIGVVSEEGKILADLREIYKPPKGKGIIPREAKKHHEQVAENLISKLDLSKIDLIAYSAGPGLPPCLLFTAEFAFKISEELKKPIIPVNHMLAHVEIGRLLTKCKDPVIVYLSGGNTMIISYAEGKYRVFGETLDIPIGNALDMVAREMGLCMPGGPEIEKLAKNGKYVELPYSVKGMDLSFSGIVTLAIRLLKKGKKEDIAYSLQETCFAMLVEVTERCLAHVGKDEVLLVGGVAANQRLQTMMKLMCEERDAKFYVVPAKFSADNGVNIAWAGILCEKFNVKNEEILETKIKKKWRIDEIEVKWI